MYNLKTSQKDSLGVAFKAAAFCAVFSTLISAALMVVLPSLGFRSGEFSSGPTAADIIRSIAFMSVITSVPFGIFGLLAGFGGAFWLRFRRTNIKSRWRLLVEALAVGFVVGGIFLFYDATMNLLSIGYFDPSVQASMLLPLSAVCAVLCALLFRRSFSAA